MGNYKFLKIKQMRILVANGHISPTAIKSEIEEKEHLEDGPLIFDLTLINGFGKNRFIEAEVLNGKIVTSSYHRLRTISKGIEAASLEYFCKNQYLVDKSSLPEDIKKKLKREI